MDFRFFATVFATVFLAELGDKTQITTFLYAADEAHSKLVVFAGAALALVATSAIGVALGGTLATYANPRLLTRLAGAGLILVGVWTIARA